MTIPAPTLKPRAFFTYHCTTCNSEDVQLDAYVTWNVAAQAMEVSTTFEKGHYCATCDGECRVETRPTERPTIPLPLSGGDPRQSLNVVWTALHNYREWCLPEGDKLHDGEWSEICTAMMWLAACLDIDEMSEEQEPVSQDEGSAQS